MKNKNYRQVEQGHQQQQAGSLQAQAQGDAALANVDADNGGTPAYFFNRGFAAAITDNGTGDLTLTLSSEQNLSTQGIVSVTLNSATAGMVSVATVGVTGIRVRTWSVTIASPAVSAAADIDYWVRVTPVSPA